MPAGVSSTCPHRTAWSAPPGHVAYCTAKGGVVNLTRQVVVDFGPRGIIVNAIAPGKTLTRPVDGGWMAY